MTVQCTSCVHQGAITWLSSPHTCPAQSNGQVTGVRVRKQVSYTATRKGYHLIIDKVPAWVCEQCGEPLYEEETVEALQRVLQGVDARLEEAAPVLAPA